MLIRQLLRGFFLPASPEIRIQAVGGKNQHRKQDQCHTDRQVDQRQLFGENAQRHPLSPRSRITNRTGVPSSPNVSRSWFSKYR